MACQACIRQATSSWLTCVVVAMQSAMNRYDDDFFIYQAKVTMCPRQVRVQFSSAQRFLERAVPVPRVPQRPFSCYWMQVCVSILCSRHASVSGSLRFVEGPDQASPAGWIAYVCLRVLIKPHPFLSVGVYRGNTPTAVVRFFTQTSRLLAETLACSTMTVSSVTTRTK